MIRYKIVELIHENPAILQHHAGKTLRYRADTAEDERVAGVHEALDKRWSADGQHPVA